MSFEWKNGKNAIKMGSNST